MRQLRFVAAAAVALSLSMGVAGGMAWAGRGITLKGSDTMVILVQRWAEDYMASHPGQVLEVTGGGSGTGIAALINGTTDICMSSRPMKEDEKRKLRDRFQSMGVEIPVAKDGLTVYLHESNPIRTLSLEQLKQIFTGQVDNWKQLGGADARIVPYSRENSSGTYVYFKDHVLGGRDYVARCQTLPGTAAVVNAVARDPNGIGYGGAAYAKGVREVAVATRSGGPGVLPSPETVRDGSYPITRYLYFYARQRPAGRTKAFVDWVLSDPGQSIVTRVGYFPIR